MTAANPHRLPSPQHQFQNFPQSSPQVAPQLHSAQQRPTPTTRKSRAFSFRSDKSHGSGSQKIDLHETSAEKEAKRLHSKADPTLAMQEAEPSEVAAYVKSSLASLRSIQHKDAFGNPIADPDRSNPTRSRWERPLDTIRSFEAAIDGGYNNRRSIIRPDGDGSTWGPSRRASYFGPSTELSNGSRPGRVLTRGRTDPNGAGFSRDSYYGSRPPSMMYANRADGSLPDLRMGGHRDSYYEQSQGYGGYGPPAQNGRRGWTGMSSGPQYGAAYKQQQQQNDYSIPNNHRSYETVTTASGSGSPAEPAGYQTDPTSSDNSSIERLHSSVPRRQPEPANDYGIGFGQSPSYQPPSFTLSTPQSASNGGGYGGAHQTSGGGHYVNAPPPVPRKDVGGGIIRKPVTANPGHQARPAQQPEKRKSWFARRFSKNA